MPHDYYAEDVARLARENDYFRRVLYTSARSQLVLMSLEPWGEIGEEIHEGVDQILVVVAGRGEAVLDGTHLPVGTGMVVVVPAGTRHNVVASGGAQLKLYTVYTPPAHAPGTVHKTKAEADVAEHEHHR
jgi:mannose-6-phosphate isomerase-like protein (cupin superfamily)